MKCLKLRRVYTSHLSLTFLCDLKSECVLKSGYYTTEYHLLYTYFFKNIKTQHIINCKLYCVLVILHDDPLLMNQADTWVCLG